VRVNDVDLAELKANGNVELRLTQVDVGIPGAVRRLLQGVVPSLVVRKLQSKLPQRSIRWEFVNLVEPDPLRRVKLRITHEKLEDLHPADLAEIMEDLSAPERQGIIASLDEETAAAVLAELDERLTTQIVEMDPGKAADILGKWRRTPRRMFWPTCQRKRPRNSWTRCLARRRMRYANYWSLIARRQAG
jgi:hypothetical protein